MAACSLVTPWLFAESLGLCCRAYTSAASSVNGISGCCAERSGTRSTTVASWTSPANAHFLHKGVAVINTSLLPYHSGRRIRAVVQTFSHLRALPVGSGQAQAPGATLPPCEVLVNAAPNFPKPTANNRFSGDNPAGRQAVRSPESQTASAYPGRSHFKLSRKTPYRTRNTAPPMSVLRRCLACQKTCQFA